jgi:hypothetical protein
MRIPAELPPTLHRVLVLGSPGQLTEFVNTSLLKRSLDRFPARQPLLPWLCVRRSRARRFFSADPTFNFYLLTVGFFTSRLTGRSVAI